MADEADEDRDEAEASAEGDARARRLAEGIPAALERIAASDRELVGAMAEHQLALWPTHPVDLDSEPEALELRRGPGRPAGSRNRATAEASEWFLRRWRSPLDHLGETFTRPVELLARELGCTKLEAKKLQDAAALGVLPYVHRRQPQAVELEGGENLPMIVLVRPDELEAMRRGELTVDDLAYEVVEDESEENQGVGAPDPGQSDGAQSDSEGK